MIPKSKLDVATRYLAETEDLIARQVRLIARLKAQGEDAPAAERLLKILIEGRERFYAQRDMLERYSDEGDA